jgi:Protein of unknown function DUF2617
LLTSVDVPFTDTRADALAFALDLPPLEPLAALTVERFEAPVELRLLGASHQVIAGPLSETVACLPGRRDPLPDRCARALPGWSYTFAAVVTAHGGEAAFRRSVETLRDRLADRADALVATFPGSPHAVTAVEVGPRTLAWRTWHAYPQTREIVMTRSRLVGRT